MGSPQWDKARHSVLGTKRTHLFECNRRELCRLSRLDEGSIFVKGKGLLLPTRNTFESQPINVEIISTPVAGSSLVFVIVLVIGRPNSVSFTKKVGRDGWVGLA